MCSGTDNRPGRARDEIDGELRLLAAVRQTIAEQGGPSRNIAVIDELLARLQETFTIACPAYPALSRTVYNGHLFVGRGQGVTVNGRIISLSSCSTMWQWYT